MACFGCNALNTVSQKSPADYWRIASAALEAENIDRLRMMDDADGLLSLNRLTLGKQIRRAAGLEKSSDLVCIAALFASAYASRSVRDLQSG